jgi:hypothetical protein
MSAACTAWAEPRSTRLIGILCSGLNSLYSDYFASKASAWGSRAMDIRITFLMWKVTRLLWVHKENGDLFHPYDEPVTT